MSIAKLIRMRMQVQGWSWYKTCRWLVRGWNIAPAYALNLIRNIRPASEITMKVVRGM